MENFKSSSLQENPTLKATRKEWIGLCILAIPCMLYSMDLTVLNLAVPAITADLKPGNAGLLWIVDIYGFMIAGSLITMGTLGDRIGRRKLLLYGAIGFGVSSILASFSHTTTQLIAARALLGISGATLAPSTLSLISNMFKDQGQRTFAIGIWTMSFSLGGAIGPVIGGLLLQHYWWGSVFLIGIPAMVLLLIAGPLLLPEFKDPTYKPLDFLSTLLSLTGVLLLVFGIKRSSQDGLDIISIFTSVTGLCLLYIFLKRQKTLKDPFIDIHLFKVPEFTAALTANSLSIFGIFGMLLYFTQFFQLVLELTPLEAGLWMLPPSMGFIIGSMLAPILRKRIKPYLLFFFGFIVAGIGFGLFLLIKVFHPLMTLVIGSIFYSIATSLLITIGVDLVVGVAPPEKAGSASGISETSTELGGALGIAILGSIGTAIYRYLMMDFKEIKLDALQTEKIHSSFAMAVETAYSMKSGGDALLLKAKEAFTISFMTVAGINMLLFFMLAGVSYHMLKEVE